MLSGGVQEVEKMEVIINIALICEHLDVDSMQMNVKIDILRIEE